VHRPLLLLAYGPYSLTSASFRMIAHRYLCSAFFLHLLTPIGFKLFSKESNQIKFGLPAFILPSGFPRYTFYTDLSSDILTRWPAPSILFAVIVDTIFGFLYVTCNSPLVRILQSFWSLIGSCIFLSIFRFHVLRDDSAQIYLNKYANKIDRACSLHSMILSCG
jgi:hypothetical protein